jgi:hypothetical protein
MHHQINLYNYLPEMAMLVHPTKGSNLKGDYGNNVWYLY